MMSQNYFTFFFKFSGSTFTLRKRDLQSTFYRVVVEKFFVKRNSFCSFARMKSSSQFHFKFLFLRSPSLADKQLEPFIFILPQERFLRHENIFIAFSPSPFLLTQFHKLDSFYFFIAWIITYENFFSSMMHFNNFYHTNLCCLSISGLQSTFKVSLTVLLSSPAKPRKKLSSEHETRAKNFCWENWGFFIHPKVGNFNIIKITATM